MPLYKLLSEALARVAGIRLHQEKTKVWNKARRAPEDVQELGPEAWQPQGLKVLGTHRHPRVRVAEDERQNRGGAPTLGDHPSCA